MQTQTKTTTDLTETVTGAKLTADATLTGPEMKENEGSHAGA